MVAICEDAQREQPFIRKRKTSTFQSNRTVVSELIWLEFNLNPSHACFEKRSLDCQRSTSACSNVTVLNLSVYESDDYHKVDERVDVPMNKVAFLEFAGLVFDTTFVFEDELEDGCRTTLYKFNK